MQVADVLETLARRPPSREESLSVFRRLLTGGFSETQIGAILAALKTRGETPEVMAGAVEALLEAAVPFPRPDYDYADCCGTGGDGAGTVNLSTAAALVAAELGIPVAKAGNRSVSSRCGSADLLERLGVRLDPSPEAARRCLDRAGICFIYAPQYHPGIRHAAPVRRALGVRTVFNLAGPLANAARPPWQLMGLYDPALCEPAVRTLALLGRTRAMAVHGSGLDELALHGPSLGYLLIDGEIRPLTLTPEMAGVQPAPLAALAGGGPDENARWLERLLAGRAPAAHRDAVALNAGALAWMAGRAPDLRSGTAQALDALAGGRCLERLHRLVEESTRA